MDRKTVVIYIVIFILVVLFPAIGWAQPGDPNGGVKPGVPITGLEWLLLGGGLWGAKKIYDYKKKIK